MKKEKTKRYTDLALHLAAAAVILICSVYLILPYFTRADEDANANANAGKHLVIKVIEDEPLVDIDDYDTPLSAFAGDRDDGAGTRHVVLMSVMLGCVIIYVLYQGINEKKLITLRKQAAKAQERLMNETGKI